MQYKFWPSSLLQLLPLYCELYSFWDGKFLVFSTAQAVLSSIPMSRLGTTIKFTSISCNPYLLMWFFNCQLELFLQYIVKLVSGQHSQYWEVMISLVKTIKKSINHSTRPEHGGWINWLSIPQIRKYNYRDIFNHYIKNYKCLIRPSYH